MDTIQIAAWLLSGGYVLAFLVLTARTARASGRKIWLFDRGQVLPAWGFRLAFLMLVVWPLLTVLPHPQPAWLVAVAAGAVLALWGQIHMGRSWRIGASEGQIGDIVTDGPFRLSRNPVFLGQILLAWSLVPFSGWPMIAAALVMTGSAMLLVRNEEAVLRNYPEWVAYAEDTPRWVGL